VINAQLAVDRGSLISEKMSKSKTQAKAWGELHAKLKKKKIQKTAPDIPVESPMGLTKGVDILGAGSGTK
jgi:hypothetical protein